MAKDETPLLEVLKGQWTSMFGMAGMFTITIFLSTLIQPFYDRDELRAFGAAGSTKAGFILIEGIFILIFTAAIIWLAKKNMQRVIQVGILFVLWIALSYSLVPMAHLAIPTAELTATTSEAQSGGQIIQELGDTNTMIFFDGDNLISVDHAVGNEGEFAGGSVNWTANISESRNESISITPNGKMTYHIMSSANDFIICDMTQWIRVDSSNGEIINRFDDNCHLGFVDSEESEWQIFGPVLMKIDEFKPVESIDSPRDRSWEWLMPEEFDPMNIISAKHIGDNHLLIISTRWAGVLEIPSQPHDDGFNPPYLEPVWNLTLSGDNTFTATTFGSDTYEIYNSSSQEFSLYLGTQEGTIESFRIQSNGTVLENDAVQFEDVFEGPIRGLLLGDCCNGGLNDLWVLDDDKLRVFMGTSKIERTRDTIIPGNSLVSMAIQYQSNENITQLTEGVILLDTNSSSFDEPLKMAVWNLPDPPPFEFGGVGISWADIIGLSLSILLMIAIILRPEWYVVNTTGILVGAGVSVMLGVSFVPWLVIIFMIAMAIYDHWAVNGSKHMLTLADTMIDLKLPILLVAPKDKGYSFLEEDDGKMVERDKIHASNVQPPKHIPNEERKTADAMFMGLGDVIFPGILVISAMTWLPDEVGFAGLHGPTAVAFGTLIGGLVGYMALMTQVARGKPQAGLPLLNGGSIIGYFITTIIVLGFDALAFNITLF